MTENLRSENEEYKVMKLSSIKSKIKKKQLNIIEHTLCN